MAAWYRRDRARRGVRKASIPTFQRRRAERPRMKSAIQKAIERRDLTQREAAEVMTQIMDGTATPAQIAAFAVALRMKGETVDEITGFARVMRQFAIQVQVETDKALVDTCGTGGDNLKTFNVSTTAALIAAAS